LRDFHEFVEICDQSGQTLGYFHPAVKPGDYAAAGIESPFSDEEIERRRQDFSGRPLAEILRDLQQS
jgi:hypothetical protein